MLARFSGGPLDGEVRDVPDGTYAWEVCEGPSVDAEWWILPDKPQADVKFTVHHYARRSVRHDGLWWFVFQG